MQLIVLTNKNINLNKKLEIIRNFYDKETGILAKYLEKTPMEYFRNYRLRLSKLDNVLFYLYVRDDVIVDNSIDNLKYLIQKELPDVEVVINDKIPFKDFKARDELIYRLITKVDTKDIPYSIYLNKQISKLAFESIISYLDLVENNNLEITQFDLKKSDPMFLSKKAMIKIDFKKNKKKSTK